jgi:glycosyltransferase involved in cell wall biosynthesis
MPVKKPKKISVIIRTYNSAKTVYESVNSALNQTLDRNLYEIIVIDDASKDNTVDILKNNYGNKIRLIKQKHSGPTKTTNNAIKECAGEYVTMLDSDDTFEPETLEKMIEVFDKDKSIDFAYCDYFEVIKNKKKRISLKKNIFKALGCGIIFKTELFKKLGLYDESLIFSEYDFLIKLINDKKKGKHIAVPLYNYRRNNGSLTFNPDWVNEGFKQLRQKYGDIVKKIRRY